MMNVKFLQHFPEDRCLDVDEAMIPYAGKHGAKMFMKGKPNRFGHSFWCLNSRLGWFSGYHLYFDNLFTSLPLLDDLSSKGIDTTGTLHANRTQRGPLPDVKAVKKESSRTFLFRYDQAKGHFICRWNDNAVVTVSWNCKGIEPVSKCRRWSAAQKTHVDAPQPVMVKQYNTYVDGMDRMDQNVAYYRIGMVVAIF